MEVRGEKIKRRGITELLNPVRLGLAACLHGWLKTKPEIFLHELYEMKVKVWTLQRDPKFGFQIEHQILRGYMQL